jgi:hypothetical protein
LGLTQIQSSEGGAGAVGFDGDLEAVLVERGDEIFVELEERLAAGANHVLPGVPVAETGLTVGPLARICARGAARPASIDRRRKLLRGRESAAVRSCANEIGVAEPADRPRAIFLSARPQVAPRETAEDCRASCLRALALQRVKNFLDRVGHCGALPASERASLA